MSLLRLRARTQMMWVGDALLLMLGDRQLRVTPFGEAELAALLELSDGCTSGQVERLDWMGKMRADGFLESVSSTSDDPDHARFDRLLNYLSELELDGSNRFRTLEQLRTSHCVLVGLGGLASWVVYNLLCCGIGRFTLVDGDVVEMSNLNRTILYTEADVGRPKVVAARETMLRFAPRTEVVTVGKSITGPDDLSGLLDRADVLVGMADQPPWLIREWIAVAAMEAGVPSIQSVGSRVGPFQVDSTSACAMCDWTAHLERQPRYGELLEHQLRLPRGDPGVLSPIGCMTAGYLSMEVVRHVLRLEPRTRDRIWRLHGDLTASIESCPPNPRCGLCASGDRARVPRPSEFIGVRQ